MDPKMERTAAAVGKNEEIADALDELLKGPNDRAFVVCSFDDCKSNITGRCTVYTIQNVPRMRTTGPCEGYEARGADPGGAPS
ncbi:hypothetical protein [Geomesophilobacter sediminis]|uniref:Uncharacterized protein n=1 Tax=Geomesophilobacter sediminis TaxID=2798584 RepID=A0A8J7SAD4_9BACT|nr:hypothetical protein [Geomesophilobacter sediminis]MBJ6727420.1 hypothetical protein [Geomesophilobacter sediminis]